MRETKAGEERGEKKGGGGGEKNRMCVCEYVQRACAQVHS
jgi:hypothetical protein